MLDQVCKRLEEGAKLGCSGRGRLPTRKGNNMSSHEFGERVSDSLQNWIKDGLVVGPVREEELPWSDYTVKRG
jgi:hypothetical protein